jgi:alginate O-acetyltransferase complex protein AlgI
MLFNSYVFILLFLPLCLVGYYAIGLLGRQRLSLAWAAVMSLLFYGWWNPAYLILFLASMLFNYGIATAIGGLQSPPARRTVLYFGICANIGTIGFYKYGNFVVDTINQLGPFEIFVTEIALPLAISFYTFQQVAYLVDTYRSGERVGSILDYVLFVSFFPQLIAGPIVHHKEMMPQFQKRIFDAPVWENLSLGFTIFIFGLFKKVVLADGVADFANPVFATVAAGETVTCLSAWCSGLAYTMQLYFDFSGYSDMAIGLARMFGITLPLNFNSPYKADSIIEFWRRWHITLSRFLRDYLYIPLGGSHHGSSRRLLNLFIVMVLGGLWHGAGWTFVIWGAFHGVLLIINHLWRALVKKIGWEEFTRSAPVRLVSWGITFILVILGWVLFRAEDVGDALSLLTSMFAPNIAGHPTAGIVPSEAWWWIIGLTLLAVLAPNTAQIFENHRYSLTLVTSPRAALRPLLFRPNIAWGAVAIGAFIYALFSLSGSSDFLYFNF